MLVDPKPVEHRTTEMDGLICQYRKLAVRKPLDRFANTGIQRGAVQHVSPIVGKKHLKTGLNVLFRGFRGERPPDQHQGAVSDETSDLVFRQKRQIELMANVVYGRCQVFFRID